jgi:hypothetical protein
MPTYPEAEIVAMMKLARKARIFSVIRGEYTCGPTSAENPARRTPRLLC